MIHVGLICADLAPCARLIGLLLRHPDVDLRWVACQKEAHCLLSDALPQYVGETDLTMVSQPIVEGTDLVLTMPDTTWTPGTDVPQNLRIVAASPTDTQDYIYGLCELNRRLLVAPQARRVVLPDVVAHAAALALLPLAKQQKVPETGILVDVAAGCYSDRTATEIAAAIRLLQPDYAGRVTLRATPDCDTNSRSTVLTVTIDYEADLVELTHLYNDYYNDHHFTYLFGREPSATDVKGANKCLLHLSRPSVSRLQITAALDSYLKGTVGNAVHCMNLLFGLDERVGLMKS